MHMRTDHQAFCFRVKELGSDDPAASTPMADEDFMLAPEDDEMFVDDADLGKQARKRNVRSRLLTSSLPCPF